MRPYRLIRRYSLTKITADAFRWAAPQKSLGLDRARQMATGPFDPAGSQLIGMVNRRVAACWRAGVKPRSRTGAVRPNRE